MEKFSTFPQRNSQLKTAAYNFYAAVYVDNVYISLFILVNAPFSILDT